MVGCKPVIFSMIYSVRVKKGANGPSSLSASLGFWVSVLFIEVVCESIEVKHVSLCRIGFACMRLGIVF